MKRRFRVTREMLVAAICAVIILALVGYAMLQRAARIKDRTTSAAELQQAIEAREAAEVRQRVLEEEKRLALEERDSAQQTAQNEAKRLIQEASREITKDIEEAKRQQTLLLDRVAKADADLAKQAELYKTADGFDVTEYDGYSLYLPKALRWQFSKELIDLTLQAAELSVRVQLGKLKRKVVVRVVTNEPKLAPEGYRTRGLFRRQGDEILLWPDAIDVSTITHELAHAWIYQEFEGAVPSTLDEAIAYSIGGTSPTNMLERLDGAEPLPRTKLQEAFKIEKEKMQAIVSAWVAVYYLHTFKGRTYNEIAKLKVEDLPEPKEVFGAVWAHARLTDPNQNITVMASALSSPWLDLVEFGPLDLKKLDGFDPKNSAQVRRLDATRQLIQYDAALQNGKVAAPYSPAGALPSAETLWKRDRTDVFRLLVNSFESLCLHYPSGVALRFLAGTTTAELITEDEFSKAQCGPELRRRCLNLAWANSYKRIFIDGTPAFSYGACGGPPPKVADLNPHRKAIVTSGWDRTGASLLSIAFWKNQ